MMTARLSATSVTEVLVTAFCAMRLVAVALKSFWKRVRRLSVTVPCVVVSVVGLVDTEVMKNPFAYGIEMYTCGMLCGFEEMAIRRDGIRGCEGD